MTTQKSFMYLCSSDDNPRLAVYTHEDVTDDIHNAIVKTSTRDASLARDEKRRDRHGTPDNFRPSDNRRHSSHTESARLCGHSRDDPKYDSLIVDMFY